MLRGVAVGHFRDTTVMTRQHTTRALLSLAILAATAVPFLNAQGADMPGMLLEAAIQKELVSGCGAATGDFESLLTRFPNDRAVVPQALWHLGQCYDRKGDARARPTLERLVSSYPEHRNAQPARAKLASYADEGSEFGTPEVVVREIYQKPEDYRQASTNNARVVIFNDLAIYDLQKDEVRRLTSGIRSAAYPIVSPDGLVAYLSWSGDIKARLQAQRDGDRAGAETAGSTELRIVRQNGTDDRALVKDSSLPWLRPYAWSPDGNQILSVFERKDGTRQIALVDRRDGNRQILTSLPWLSPQGMGFSPDGAFIAYEVATPRNSRQQDFYILPVKGNDSTIERRYSLNLAAQRAAVLTEA